MAIVLAVGSMVGTAAAASSTVPLGTYLVCPDISTGATVGGGECISMTAALADIAAENNAQTKVTLELLPGDYCPITLPYGYLDLTFQGVGNAGFTDAGVAESTEFEAAASSFVDAAACNSSSADLISFTTMNSTDWYSATGLTIDNVAFVGNGASSGSTLSSMGPHDVGISFRDDLFEDFAGYGLDYTGDDLNDQEGFDVTNSAFVDNGTGVFLGGYSSIDESTFAGNGVGLIPEGMDYFASDTITSNTTGVEVNGNNFTSQVNDTIVAGNTTDCSGDVGDGGDWESGSQYDDDNLQGASCENSSNSADATDIVFDPTQGAFGSRATAGLTPYYNPPKQAVNATGDCHFGADQEEGRIAAATCDIGSIQSGANATPTVSISPGATVDFGTVPSNQTASASVNLVNTAGGIVGIQSITSTNPDFAVTTDGCTYNLLVDVMDTDGCTTALTFTPTTTTTETSTLQIVTTDGEMDVALTGEVGPPVNPPGQPTAIKTSVGDGSATFSWTAPASDGGSPITGYDVRVSDDGGTTWTEYDATDSTTTSFTTYDLADGESYVAEVAAENAYYTYQTTDGSPFSAASAPFKPVAPVETSALTAPKSATITEGRSVTLSTILTNKGEALANATVMLLSKPAGSSTFSRAAIATTNVAGLGTATVKPTTTTVYEFTFGGGGDVNAAIGNTATVTVDRTLKATRHKSTVKKGKVDDIFGTSAPVTTGLTVTLQLKSGNGWKSVRTTKAKKQTLPNGKKEISYLFDYKPKSKGKQTLRVSCARTSTNGPAVSNQLHIKVT